MRLRNALAAVPIALALAVGAVGHADALVPRTLSWVGGYQCNFDLFHYADISVRRDVIGNTVKAYQLHVGTTNTDVFWGQMIERKGSTYYTAGNFYGPIYEDTSSPVTRLPYMTAGKSRYAVVDLWATGKHCRSHVLIRGPG